MKFRKVFWILITLISVNCMKEDERMNLNNNSLLFLKKLLPNHSQLKEGKVNEILGITLSGTSINDETLKNVLILKSLTSLSLTNTKITEIGLESIKENKIDHLDIDATQISNKAIKVLLEWKHLKVLNISYTNIDDGALDDILKLNVSLIAAGTKLSKGAKEKIRKKMQFEDEDYEIQW